VGGSFPRMRGIFVLFLTKQLNYVHFCAGGSVIRRERCASKSKEKEV